MYAADKSISDMIQYNSKQLIVSEIKLNFQWKVNYGPEQNMEFYFPGPPIGGQEGRFA